MRAVEIFAFISPTMCHGRDEAGERLRGGAPVERPVRVHPRYRRFDHRRRQAGEGRHLQTISEARIGHCRLRWTSEDDLREGAAVTGIESSAGGSI